MELKRVSFKVAKALKEAGYPQTKGLGFDLHGIGGKPVNKDGYSQPTYLDVWLWLWREKRIYLQVRHRVMFKRYGLPEQNFSDLEKAIESSINYLVDNNLIK